MLSTLLQEYHSGAVDVFEVLEHVTDIEYRLDRRGKYKGALLFFGEETLSTESGDPTINEVYRMKLNLMLGKS